MKAGDKIRIISGEHRGKRGVVVSEREMTTEPGEVPEGERDIGWWFVVFEDGSGTLHESELEVI